MKPTFVFGLLCLVCVCAPPPPKPNLIEDFYWLKEFQFCIANWQCDTNNCKGNYDGEVLGRCASKTAGVFFKPFPITLPFNPGTFKGDFKGMYGGCCKVRFRAGCGLPVYMCVCMLVRDESRVCGLRYAERR